MPNKTRLTYIAGFIAVGWIASAVLIGFFLVLAHFVKSSTAGITVFLVVLYSCLFGLLGWQVQMWKGRRDGWPAADTRDRRRARLTHTARKYRDNTEDESGWKRS
jgi:hypothetical protein